MRFWTWVRGVARARGPEEVAAIGNGVCEPCAPVPTEASFDSGRAEELRSYALGGEGWSPIGRHVA